MSLYIGNDKIGSLYLGSTKIKEAWVGDVKVYGSVDPYNPLGLPPFTIRGKFSQGYTPTPSGSVIWDSATLVDPTENVWDITRANSDWTALLSEHGRTAYLLEVLGANSTGVTNMEELFASCKGLTHIEIFDTSSVTNMRVVFDTCLDLPSIPLFDTRRVTDMTGMFGYCRSLATIPLLNTSSVVNMDSMFLNCGIRSVPALNTSSVRIMHDMFWCCSNLQEAPSFDTHNVEDFSYMFYAYPWSSGLPIGNVPLYDTSSAVNVRGMFLNNKSIISGALSLYRQMSTQTNPPQNYGDCFTNCGINTQTGLAELQQIPESWGGLAPG